MCAQLETVARCCRQRQRCREAVRCGRELQPARSRLNVGVRQERHRPLSRSSPPMRCSASVSRGRSGMHECTQPPLQVVVSAGCRHTQKSTMPRCSQVHGDALAPPAARAAVGADARSCCCLLGALAGAPLAAGAELPRAAVSRFVKISVVHILVSWTALCQTRS